MRSDKALVIPLPLHPAFRQRHRLEELKTALGQESLAFAQVALDNAVGPGGVSPRAVKILERACALLAEARDRLVYELL